jgi:zinc/manganese transport system substrate-binding protein
MRVDIPETPMLRSKPMFCRRSPSPFCAVVLILLPLFLPDLVWSAPSPEPMNVVVTIPVLKDLTEQVGGHHVHVTSLLRGYENEHTYSPKPSDLIAVRKARLLFEVGIGLEVWVAKLVKNAGRPSLKVVTTSQGIALIRDGQGRDGDHLGREGNNQGNPHVWLDPENAETMLRHITETLIQVDPDHAQDYRKNQASYLHRLDLVRTELSERVRNLSDKRFIAHHPAWPYFARRFGFQIVGTIQSQSAGEPSAFHIQNLIATMKKEKIRVVVSEIQLSQKLPDLLAKEAGARVVVLTTLPGGLPRTETYLDMLRYNVLQLANALEAA